ncbi:MAG: apolipoprotein N-acyltransferase [Planctomycetota bacterium]|nr:MAG: apolipoprotein N-acyltransferase [Planctomycetota bacterium]
MSHSLQSTAIGDRAAPDRSRRTLVLGLAAAVLCYLAHPPVGWSLLAWIGPSPWLYLACLPRMPGRRPYGAVWASGVVYWLLTIQWIRLPHPANALGLVLLAAYLGVYILAFVAITRIAVHRWRMPVWLAGSIAWTGLEWLRARLLTGFLMASLAHTQVRWPHVIQIADIFGEYGVTFLVVLVAGAIAEAAYRFGHSSAWPAWRRALPLLPAAVCVGLAVGYARLRIDALESQQTGNQRTATIALIQSDMLADWKGTTERDIAAMRQMYDLSRQAVRTAKQPVDIVIWPETMYRDPLLIIDPDRGPAAGALPAEVVEATAKNLATMAADLNAALLLGIERFNTLAAEKSAATPHGYRFEAFNSCVCVDRTGAVVGTYDKMHLLPFGEFIPLVDWLPALRNISPIAGGSLEGAHPAAFEVDGVSYCPNICYETVLPHLIRRQVVELIGRSRWPDVLVNLTNDAWYWGSSELDMHLASGVFRAVEMRLPLVVAANRGLSAYVDYRGRIVQVTERDRAACLVAEVELPPRRLYPSHFARYGDWFALACLVCCGITVVASTVAAAQRAAGAPREVHRE